MNTYYFNSRCKQNYLEDTSGPGIHRGTHLGAPFSLRMTWTSTTSGLCRQNKCSVQDKVFDTHYQYGIVKHVYQSRDGLVRKAEIEYQNHQERVKRTTVRGVRELVVIHRFEEYSIDEVLFEARTDHTSDSSAAHYCGCGYSDAIVDC